MGDAFDLLAVMEVHNLLFTANMQKRKDGDGLDRAAFKAYIPCLDIALRRVRAMEQDANAGAYYKVAGEMFAFAEEYATAAQLLGEAVRLFGAEDKQKIGDLIRNSNDLKESCDRQVAAAAQAAPKPEA